MSLNNLEKHKLSRKTILEWYKNSRLSKLKALQKMIIDVVRARKHYDIDRIKRKVIRDTKADLAKNKSLNEREKLLQATHFANELLLVGRKYKSIDELAKRYVQEQTVLSSDKLVENWLKPKKMPGDDGLLYSPRYDAMRLISNKTEGREAYLMLGIIEKHWGLKTAHEQFEKMWDKKYTKYNPNKLRAFFSEERTRDKLGFYYGSNRRTYDWLNKSKSHCKKLGLYNCDSIWWTRVGSSTMVKEIPLKHGAHFITTPDDHDYWVTGWWTKDETPGDYDEFTFTHNLTDAVKKIKSELDPTKSNYDSGLSVDDAKDVIASFDWFNNMDFSKFNVGKYAYDNIVDYDKRHHNKWALLAHDKHSGLIGAMSYLFGKYRGWYLYRYDPVRNKIFFLKYSGDEKKKPSEWGEVTVKKVKGQYIVDKWVDHSKDKNYLKREIADHVPLAAREKEMLKEKTSKNVKEDPLYKSAGVCEEIMTGKTKYRAFKYKDLSKFLNRLKRDLEVYLEKRRGHDKKDAKRYADARIKYVETEIDKAINEDTSLRKLINENNQTSIKVEIDGFDKITVLPGLRDKARYKKLELEQKAKDKALDAKNSSPKTMESAVTSKVEKFAKKYMGPLAPLFLMLFDVPKKIKNLLTKDNPATGYIAGALGLGGLRSRIGSKHLTQESVHRILKGRVQKYEAKRKLFAGEKLTLKGIKIVIPKGKGIHPGAAMWVRIRGNDVKIHPDRKPKFTLKHGWSKALSSLKGGKKYILKDEEIEIIPKSLNTSSGVIPKGTIFPRGTRIEKYY